MLYILYRQEIVDGEPKKTEIKRFRDNLRAWVYYLDTTKRNPGVKFIVEEDFQEHLEVYNR